VIIRGYYFVFSTSDIAELTEIVPTWISLIDTEVKITTFYLQNEVCSELLNNLLQFMRTGFIL
jgi:hypothetical protein